MAITTKRVTMSDTAWDTVRKLVSDGDVYGFASIDCRDAITALAEAEVVAVSETYSEDKWAIDAQREGRTP